MRTRALSSTIVRICAVLAAALHMQASYAEYGYLEHRGGVIDLHGKVIIPIDYAHIEFTGDGFQATRKIDGNWLDCSDFDRTGARRSFSPGPSTPADKTYKGLPPNYTMVFPIQGKGVIARADAANGGKYGYIDENGHVQISFKFDSLRDVREARILAGKIDKAGVSHYSLYDTSGHLVAELPDFAHDYANGVYQEGLLPVGDDIGRAFLDLNGKIAIPPNEYRYPSPFYGGLA